MPDAVSRLEQELRAALRDEGDRIRLTVSGDRLRRVAAERRRRRRALLVVAGTAAAAVLVVGAVGLAPYAMQPEVGASPSNFASPSGAPTPAASGSEGAFLGPTDVPLRCEPALDGQQPGFLSGVFAAPATAQTADDPAAAALRPVLGTEVDGQSVPRSGYILASETPDAALFLAPAPDQRAPDVDPYVQVLVTRADDGAWKPTAAGPCVATRVLDAGRATPWVLDGMFPAPDPTSEQIRLFTDFRPCADLGWPDEAPILSAPPVIEGDDWVAIGMATIDLSPYCALGARSSGSVQLDAPLGDRVLLDISRYPFRTPVWSAAAIGDAPVLPAFSGPGRSLDETSGSGGDPTLRREIELPSHADTVRVEVYCTGTGTVAAALDDDRRSEACATFMTFTFVAADERAVLELEAAGTVRYAARVVALTSADRRDPGPSAGVAPPAVRVRWSEGTADAWADCATLLKPVNDQAQLHSCGDEWQLVPLGLAGRPEFVPQLDLVADPAWTIVLVRAQAVAVADVARAAAPSVGGWNPADLPVEGDARSSSFTLPGLGDWMIRLELVAERDDTLLEAAYFARITTTRP